MRGALWFAILTGVTVAFGTALFQFVTGANPYQPIAVGMFFGSGVLLGTTFQRDAQ